jgi:hypothetical protein
MEEERTRSDSIDSLFGASSSPMKKGVSSKKSFSDLFGNSNDDNLFDEVEDEKMSLPKGTPQEKSAPIPTQSMPNKRASVGSMNASALYGEGLFDEDDDTDIFGAPKVQSSAKSAAPEKTKKFSNLFGGDDDVDPFGASSKPKVSQPPKASKPAKSDLFGGDDDDDDSLFGAPKKSAAPAAKPETKPVIATTTAKKPVASDLFGDDDDDDDLFGSKTKPKVAPGATNVKNPSPLDEPEAEAPRPKSAAMAGAQASAFALAAAAMPRRPPSDDDDDDDEDIPKAKPVVVAKAAPVASKSTKSDLFGGDDDDDSLFGAPKNSAPVTTTVPKPETKPEPIPETKSDPTTTPPPAVATPVSDSSEASTLATKRPVSNKLASRMSGLDPSKIIMPGMAPPPKFKKSTPVAEDYEANDTPTEAPLGKAKRTGVVTEAGEMVNVTMDRATVKKTGKSRKAPSRKKPAIDGDTVVPLVSAEDDDGERLDPVEPVQTAPVAKTDSFKAKGLFGDDDDLPVSKPVAVAVAVPAKVEPAKVASNAGLFGDDDSSLLESPKKSIPTKPDVSKAGLFGDDEAPLSIPVASAQAAKSDPLKASVKGGLFGDDADEPLALAPKPAAVKSEPVKTVAKASALFGDDDDGLFSASTTTKPVTQSKPVVTKPAAATKGLFGDDDDGLFGSSSLSQKSTAKPAAAAPVTTKPVAKSLFGDDDDGLFGSSASSSKPATKAPAAAKASSLFGDDDDDLFGGAKKSKPSGASNAKARGLFDD